MNDLQKLCIEEGTSISDGIRRLDEAGEKIVLVTRNEKLTGTITDGDVRRWILRKGSFEEDVSKMMHKSPKVVMQGEVEKAKRLMLEFHIEAIPVVDCNYIPLANI